MTGLACSFLSFWPALWEACCTKTGDTPWNSSPISSAPRRGSPSRRAMEPRVRCLVAVTLLDVVTCATRPLLQILLECWDITGTRWGIASHRIASHRIASHRTASHCLALHRTSSHVIALHRTASHCIALHRRRQLCDASNVRETSQTVGEPTGDAVDHHLLCSMRGLASRARLQAAPAGEKAASASSFGRA